MQRGSRLRHWSLMREISMHQRPIFLGTHSQIDDPFVEPGCLQRSRRHFGDGSGGIWVGIWAAKRSEPLLRTRADVRIARIERTSDSGQDHERRKKFLKQHVHVHVGSQVTPHTEVPVGRVKNKLIAWHPAACYVPVFRDRGHVIGTTLVYREEALEQLRDRLRTHECGLKKELREIGSLHIAVTRKDLPAE